jgi:RNA polymerase sigma-70 factor (ECF subfamily)
MDDGNLDSLELLQRARGKSESASRDLLTRFRNPLLNRIRLMMGARARRTAESQDFLQEVMVDFLEASTQFDIDEETDILRWLTAVARNNIRDAAKRPRVRAFDSLSASFSSDDIAEKTPSPSSQLAMHEEAIRLAEGLEHLKEDYQQVIELHNLEGLGLKEVASRMGRSYEATKKLHTRAMMQLGIQLSSRNP